MTPLPLKFSRRWMVRWTTLLSRETEGQALKALIEQRLEGVTAEVVKVRSHMPEILQWQRERLVAKLEDAQVQLENNRLEQELVLLAQRIDVAEELDRLEAHVKETYNILKKRSGWSSSGFYDAGVQPRVEHSCVEVYQCRSDKLRHRAESVD